MSNDEQQQKETSEIVLSVYDVPCEKCQRVGPLFRGGVPWCKQCVKASMRLVQCSLCGEVPALSFGERDDEKPWHICCGKCYDRFFPSNEAKDKSVMDK